MNIIMIACLAWLSVWSPAFALEPRAVRWDDLVPPSEPLANPLDQLDMSIRFDIAFAAQVRADIAKGSISPHGAEARQADAIAGQIAARGVDAEPLIRQYLEFSQELGRRGSGMVEELIGTEITLPGYALPLELDADGVREFLLVPYVGACIHVPPPPPNQIVHVTSEKAIEFEGLFEPVQVTGLLTSEEGSMSLSFVDGSDEIATGYRLTNVDVEPFAE